MGAKKRKQSRWLERHRRDGFVRQAVQHGYRSRAAFKLIQIDERDRLLRPRQRVVDLGAAPGGWSQYVVQRAGAVVAVDRLEMQPITGAEIIHGDFTDARVQSDVVTSVANRRADLVLSDMAPNISGIGAADEANWMALLEALEAVTPQLLATGGSLLLKLFENPAVSDWRREWRRRFRSETVRKPDASRSQSREFYALYVGFKGD